MPNFRFLTSVILLWFQPALDTQVEHGCISRNTQLSNNIKIVSVFPLGVHGEVAFTNKQNPNPTKLGMMIKAVCIILAPAKHVRI